MDDIHRQVLDLQKIESEISSCGLATPEGIEADVKLQDAITPQSPSTESTSKTSENGASDKSEQIKKASQRRPTRRKPDFDVFLENVRQVITSETPKDPVALLLTTMTLGYTGKPDSDHTPQVFSILKCWSQFGQFALRLSSVLKQKRKSHKIASSLQKRLVWHAREITEFPKANEHSQSREQRHSQLMTWIGRTTPETSPPTTEVALNEHDWACWALVCLMEEPWSIRTEGFFLILERFSEQGQAQKTEEESDAELFFELGSIFGARKVPQKKISDGMKLISAARYLEQYTRDELHAANLTIDAKDSRVGELVKEVRELTTAIATADETITTLNQLVAQKILKIDQAKEERRQYQEHAELLNEQRSAKKTSEMSSRVAHEISEARHCLNEETPNVRMALDRLNRMEKWLEKFKGN